MATLPLTTLFRRDPRSLVATATWTYGRPREPFRPLRAHFFADRELTAATVLSMKEGARTVFVGECSLPELSNHLARSPVFVEPGASIELQVRIDDETSLRGHAVLIGTCEWTFRSADAATAIARRLDQATRRVQQLEEQVALRDLRILELMAEKRHLETELRGIRDATAARDARLQAARSPRRAPAVIVRVDPLDLED
jgi:hypothetical protein